MSANIPRSKPRGKLTDRVIEAEIDFAYGKIKTLHDSVVTGLRIRIGRHRRTWIYAAEYQRKGKRGSVFKRLGFFPHMGVIGARKAALLEAAKVAAGRPQPGRREAMTLAQATAYYVESLRARGKRSARQVERVAEIYLLPDFGRWTLAELSDNPQIIRDHHKTLSRAKPVGANRAMAILKSIYRHAARLDRSLPPQLPTSGVTMNKEQPAQTALPFDQYPAWRSAVEKLPPVRRGYYLFLLLTGLRGQDAQRLQWSDLNLRTRSIAITQQKTGKSFSIPMTAAIMSALKLARTTAPGEKIFPNARKWNDDLPAKGHDLRHSYINVAHDIGVNEIHVRLLVGHSLTGVHASYLTQMVMEGGPGLRGAQRAISRRIVMLLGQA